jgi:outer membrane protein OmpA-like peptidoglycan-associated protein
MTTPFPAALAIATLAIATLAIATLAFATLAVATGAQAQVTTNDQALDSLKSTAPAAAPAKPAPVAHPAHRAARRGTAHSASKAAPLPAVPAAPPANPVIIPPPPVIPAHPKPMPPPVAIKPDAAGASTLIPGGVRLTFGPGTADLNPATNQALLNIAKLAQLDPAMVITINAWAPGTQEDPSTPRRLSLDRALAARAVLINAGIPSERIYAVAKGFNGIEPGPADRLDILVAHPKSTPPGTPTLPPAPAKSTDAPAKSKAAPQ